LPRSFIARDEHGIASFDRVSVTVAGGPDWSSNPVNVD
jgi:hypothetical protein